MSRTSIFTGDGRRADRGIDVSISLFARKAKRDAKNDGNGENGSPRIASDFDRMLWWFGGCSRSSSHRLIRELCFETLCRIEVSLRKG